MAIGHSGSANSRLSWGNLFLSYSVSTFRAIGHHQPMESWPWAGSRSAALLPSSRSARPTAAGQVMAMVRLGEGGLAPRKRACPALAPPTAGPIAGCADDAHLLPLTIRPNRWFRSNHHQNAGPDQLHSAVSSKVVSIITNQTSSNLRLRFRIRRTASRSAGAASAASTGLALATPP